MTNLVNLIDGTYYLTLTSVGRRALVEEPGDLASLERYLQRAVQRQTVTVCAYCWLRRELHLGIELKNGTLASFVRAFAAAVAREKNRRTERFGPLFSSGYGALLIHRETVLLPLVRYLHLLPAFLNLAKDPGEYPWSSHRAFLDPPSRPSWLTPVRSLSLLSSDPELALKRYKTYTKTPLSTAECMAFLDSDKRIAVGPQEWLDQVSRFRERYSRHGPPLQDFLAQKADSAGYTMQTLASRSQTREHSRARALIARSAIAQGIASLSAVARSFNRTPSAMYLAIQSHAGDPDVRELQKLQNSERHIESHWSD